MQAGDKIKVLIKKNNKWSAKERVYISETDKIILVDTGNYKETINKFDIKCGRVKIQLVEDEDMYGREPKITREQLIEECNQHGTGKEAREAIAKKYGLTEGTIQNYIYKRWKITDELNTIKYEQESTVEQIQDQQSGNENSGIDKKDEEMAEKMIKTIKDSQPNVSKPDSLEVLSMTIKGKNGIYRTCENGIELTDNNVTMFFESPEQVDEFWAEYKAVFAKIRK